MGGGGIYERKKEKKKDGRVSKTSKERVRSLFRVRVEKDKR